MRKKTIHKAKNTGNRSMLYQMFKGAEINQFLCYNNYNMFISTSFE